MKDFKDIANKTYYERYDKLLFQIYMQGFLDGIENKLSNIFNEKEVK